MAQEKVAEGEEVRESREVRLGPVLADIGGDEPEGTRFARGVWGWNAFGGR